MNISDVSAQIKHGSNYQKLINQYYALGQNGPVCQPLQINDTPSGAAHGARDMPLLNITRNSHHQNFQVMTSLNSSNCDLLQSKNHNFSNKMVNNSHYHNDSGKNNSKNRKTNGQKNVQNEQYHQQAPIDEPNMQPMHNQNRIFHTYQTSTPRDMIQQSIPHYKPHPKQHQGHQTHNYVMQGEKENKGMAMHHPIHNFKNNNATQLQPHSNPRLQLSYNKDQQPPQVVNGIQRPKSTKNPQNCLTSPKVGRSSQVAPASTSGKMQYAHQQQHQQNVHQGKKQQTGSGARIQNQHQEQQPVNGPPKMASAHRPGATVTGPNGQQYKQKENHYKAPQKSGSGGAHSTGRVAKKSGQYAVVQQKASGAPVPNATPNPMAYNNGKAIFCASARVGNHGSGPGQEHPENHQQQAYYAPRNPTVQVPSNMAPQQLQSLSPDHSHCTQHYTYLQLLNSSASKQQQHDAVIANKQLLENSQVHLKTPTQQHQVVVQEHDVYAREPQHRGSSPGQPPQHQPEVDGRAEMSGSQSTRVAKGREQQVRVGNEITLQQIIDLQNNQWSNQAGKLQASEKTSHRVNWVEQPGMDVIPEKRPAKQQNGTVEQLTQRNKPSSGFASGGGESAATSSSVSKQRQPNKQNMLQQAQYVFSQTQTLCNSASQSRLGGPLCNVSKTAQCPSSSRIFQFSSNQPGPKPVQTSSSRTTRSKGTANTAKENTPVMSQSSSIYNNYKSFIEKQKKIVAQLSQSKFQTANNLDQSNEQKSKTRSVKRTQGEQASNNNITVTSEQTQYQSNNNQRLNLSSTQKLKIQNEVRNEVQRNQQQQPRRQHNSGAATHRRDFIQENKRLSGQTQNQNAGPTNTAPSAGQSQKKSSSQNQTSKGSAKNLQVMMHFNNQRKQAQEQSRQAVNASAISGLSQKSNSVVQANQRKQIRTAQGAPAQPSGKKALSSSRVGAAGGKSPKNSAFSFYDPRPSLQHNGLQKQTSKGKIGFNRQSILNQTIGVVQHPQRKRKTSDKSGKASSSNTTSAAWTHRGGPQRLQSRPAEADSKLRKNTSSQNIKPTHLQNYDTENQVMAQTHNPEAMAEIFKTVQIQNKTLQATTAEIVTFAAGTITQNNETTIQQEDEGDQVISNKEISEQSKDQLVLQQPLNLSVPQAGASKRVDEVQNILINSNQKNQGQFNNSSSGVVLLSSSRQNMSGKKSGCFGNFENDEAGTQQTLQDRQATERKSSCKISSASKKVAKQDKENQANESAKPAQNQRNQDESNKAQRTQIQETNAPQVLQQNNNKQNIHQANVQQVQDDKQQKQPEQQQQSADQNLNDTMIFSKNSSLDDYIIGKQIGQGAYAVVRIGLHKPTNQKVAMKIYKKYKLEEPNRRRSVKREIKLMERMRHQNIIQLYEIIDTSKYVILVMEYVGGGSLHGYLKSKPQRRLEEWDAKRIFKQILEGLKYCHTRCITHRDIKLENLLLDDKNNIKIIDFGFSTCIPNDKKIKIFCGTPSYMAPEIVLKTEYCGPPADIWALGVLLFTILSGQFPYRGATDEELYNKICKADYHLPSTVQNSLSSEAKDLLAKLFSIKADERPSARDLLQHPWLQNMDDPEHNKETKDGGISQLQSQEYLSIQKRAKSQRLDGAASAVTQKKQNYQTHLNLNKQDEKVQETTPFNPFKMLPETPQNQQKILLSPSNQQIAMHPLSQTMIRSNSHVIVGQKDRNHEQNFGQLNENIIKTIVDKLGYTKEEVRYLVLSSQGDHGQKTDEESNSFVVTLYNRLLAEEREKERQTFSATQRFTNALTFSNNAVSQTSLGLSGHGPPDGSNGQQSQGFFGIGNLQQKFGVQPSYVPSVKSLNGNGACSYLNISNNMMIQNQKCNNAIISSTSKSNVGVNATADDASPVSPIDGRQMNKNEAQLQYKQQDIENNMCDQSQKLQSMNTNLMLNSSSSKTLQGGENKDFFANIQLHAQNHQFGHQMMFNNFFATATDPSCNQGTQDHHQHPAFLPHGRALQNHEGYPESPDFNKTQKTSALQHIRTKNTDLNAFEGEGDGATGQHFEIVLQRSKTPKTINNYGVSQRMQKI